MGMYNVRIVAKDRDDARRLDEMNLDLHRRGTQRQARDRFLIPGLLTGEQVDLVKKAGFEVQVVKDVSDVPLLRAAEVSRTNRFDKVTTAAEMAPMTVQGYLNVDEIDAAAANLSTQHSAVAKLIELPNKTWEDRISHAVRLGAGSQTDRIGVMFTGSMHAREWGGSDICVSFMNNLVNAYEKEIPLRIGPVMYSSDQVKSIVEKIWIYIFPCVNPDGKHYSQTLDQMWRKNRNTNGTSDTRKQGVDINRNFDFLWSSDFGASSDPADPTYKGIHAFSEPESRNVKYLFDTYGDIRYYVDIHSFSGLILCAWGDDDNQSIVPSQNFLNPAFNGKRGMKDGSAYREYIPLADDLLSLGIAGRMNEACAAVGDHGYVVQPGIELYATTGTSSDYAYSRHIADSSKTKIMGYTIEFGTEFIPVFREMQEIIKLVNAAMVELCWIAAN